MGTLVLINTFFWLGKMSVLASIVQDTGLENTHVWAPKKRMVLRSPCAWRLHDARFKCNLWNPRPDDWEGASHSNRTKQGHANIYLPMRRQLRPRSKEFDSHVNANQFDRPTQIQDIWPFNSEKKPHPRFVRSVPDIKFEQFVFSWLLIVCHYVLTPFNLWLFPTFVAQGFLVY
jgi:hypothetical protein